jgi:hypothetical protein
MSFRKTLESSRVLVRAPHFRFTNSVRFKEDIHAFSPA